MIRLLLSVVCISATIGCKASVSGEAHIGGEAKEEEIPDFDKPLDTPVEAQAEFEESESDDYALLGARQDLSFEGAPKARCACLAVALGQPGDPEFGWATEKPKLNTSTELVIALSSHGIDCPGAPEGSLGASYWGYKTEGNNVVVIVEEAHEGRPVTAGAVIPRPGPDGSVYVKPITKKVPYGRALDGGAQCLIGNPGAPAAAPPSSEIEPEENRSGVRIREESEPLDTSSDFTPVE